MQMYSIILAGLLFLQIPDTIPSPGEHIVIPAGPLPWAMPQFPQIDIDLGIGTPDYDEVAHTDDYADNLAALEDRLGTGEDTEVDINTEFSDWIGEDANLPEMSTEDFDTRIDLPGYEDMSAGDIASELGTNIGTLFANVRALMTLDLDIGGGIVVIGVMVLCMAWMILIRMIRFGIQFVDMLFSVATRLIELIPFVE